MDVGCDYGLLLLLLLQSVIAGWAPPFKSPTMPCCDTISGALWEVKMVALSCLAQGTQGRGPSCRFERAEVGVAVDAQECHALILGQI